MGISSADTHLKAATTNKLKLIYDQIQSLQEQARECLEEAKRDKMLHQAACNMVKKPGTTYYLYEKPLNDSTGATQTYFSILSPEDWGKDCPNKFLGAYFLGYDMKFTEVSKAKADLEVQSRINDIYNRFTATGPLALEGSNDVSSFKISDINN